MPTLELQRVLEYADSLPVLLPLLLGWICHNPAAMQVISAVPPNAGIFGRVVNGQTRETVRRAVVKVYDSKDQWDEFTDGEGRFRLPKLPPGDYNLIAHRDGYSDRFYKVERSDFDGQKELPVELFPQAVITGRVIDSLGQGLQSASIEALPGRATGKTEVLTATETNDLGEYRLSGLDPGTYRLRAVYREGRAHELDPTPLTIASAFYGGSAGPAPITVRSGSVTTGIDFILNPVHPATVHGTLRTESEPLTDHVTMWIMGQSGEGGHNASGADGKFEIADVAPGTYTISAQTLNKATPLFGVATVEVHGDDVDTVDIVLRPVPVIEGELRYVDGAMSAPDPGSIFFMRTGGLTAMPMEIVHPDANQKFRVALIPGEYHLTWDGALRKLDARQISLDGKPIIDWKVQIDEFPAVKKLVFVFVPQTQP